jgi:hypothetical protein
MECFNPDTTNIERTIHMQNRVGAYSELVKWVDVFNRGAIDVLIIEGTAGAGKSSIVRQGYVGKRENEYCWLEGRTTAAALYHRLYENRDIPIIIDDVDGLYRCKECVNLLKCLCQTEEEKRVMWNTMTRIKGAVPSEFKTRSKVCIITNCWRALNKHVGAVQDRGLLILFHPPAIEVHRYVKEELGHLPGVYDEEVYNFIGVNLGIISEPSIRHYRNAIKLKNAGMDWTSVLIESFGLTDNQMMVLKLCKDCSLSHNQRAEIFAKELSLSARTYWRVKVDLEERGMRLG